MLANVLNSERAAQTSVQVVRAFVRLRQMLASNAELARKLAALENKYDAQFKVVFDANPPIGMKLGDDAEEIDLNLTLEKYAITKDFLTKILSNLMAPIGLKTQDLMTEGAIDRLVLASGGVARDFLSIFRRSVDVARERSSDKINAEDINMASGEYDTSKREEFKRDTYDEEDDSLTSVFQNVRAFCLEKVNSNCFLLNKDAKGKHIDQIHELVDLKLLHLIRSRVTVKSTRQGQIYEAYMLDLCQYAGARKRRDLQMVEFWKPDAEDKLRRVSLIFDDGNKG
jgi:Cdc6-like AAA superfamily ATPase